MTRTLFITISDLLDAHEMLGRCDTWCSQSGEHIILLGFPHISNTLRSQVSRFPLAWYHRVVGVIVQDGASFSKAFKMGFPEEWPIRPRVIAHSYITR